MITAFNNVAVTHVALDVIGKRSPAKKPWLTASILGICDKRKELRIKRHELEGAKNYREMNNIIKKPLNKQGRAGSNNSAQTSMQTWKQTTAGKHVRLLKT